MFAGNIEQFNYRTTCGCQTLFIPVNGYSIYLLNDNVSLENTESVNGIVKRQVVYNTSQIRIVWSYPAVAKTTDWFK